MSTEAQHATQLEVNGDSNRLLLLAQWKSNTQQSPMYCFRACVCARERESALALSAVSDFLFPLVAALEKRTYFSLLPLLHLLSSHSVSSWSGLKKLTREWNSVAKVLGKILKRQIVSGYTTILFLYFTWHLNKHTQDLLFDSQPHYLPGRDTDVNILRCSVCTFLKFALRPKKLAR